MSEPLRKYQKVSTLNGYIENIFMRDYKRNNYKEKRDLQLIADEVIKTLPMPFGSLKKSKYVMEGYNHRGSLYSFVTSVHNLEESLEIMKDRFESWHRHERAYRVYRIQDGVKELIYTNKKVWKGNSIIVLSSHTGNAELN